jgi:uncharacterized protein YegL
MKTWQQCCVCAVLIATLCSTASAQMLVPRTEADKGDLPPLEVKYQHVAVEISDQVARTSIEQVFINNTTRDLEATYFFPLSEQASIYDFAYYVKGERIAGEIREKQEARRTYDRIVARMKDPAILEQVGRNLFKAQIYPVSPDEPMEVELKYSEILPYDKGKIRYTYPLAMKGKATQLGDLTVSVDLKDQKNITKVYSETYDVDAAIKDEHHAVASFEEMKITPDRDFSLVYEVESEEFGVNFVAYRPDPSRPGYFMLIMCPQEKTTKEDIVRKDVIFVFDRSGSMKGEKIEQAKAAMKYCVESLSESDRFTVLTFASDTTSFRDALVPVTTDNKRAAADYIGDLQARGGTAINDALLGALAMFEDTGTQKTIIFCTDGRPTVGEQDVGTIIKNVRTANRKDVHVFCFGVGDDVDDYLLLKLAKGNRGTEQHVRGGESIEVKVGDFYDKVNTPLLVDLKLDFGKIPTETIHPRELPDVFKGTQLFVAGRYKEPGHTDILLTGDLNGEEQDYEQSVTFPERESGNGFVGRVWARKRVDYLVDLIRLEGENEEVKDEIIALSKEWTVQTPYTSFLAIPKQVKEEMRIAEERPAAPPQPVFARPESPRVTTSPVPTDRVTASGSYAIGLPAPRGDAGAPGPLGARGDKGDTGPRDGPPTEEEVRAIAGRLLVEFGPELADLRNQIDDLETDVDDLGERKPSLPARPADTVPLDHWSYDAVQKLIDEGVIVGYPKTQEFKGDRPMTRYELAMAVSRLMEWRGGEPVTRYQAAAWFARLAEDKGLKLDLAADCPFADISGGHAQRQNICALVAAGIIRAGATFDGDKPLLRRQFAEWAAELLRAVGVDTGERDALQIMRDEGILIGFADGAMHPDEPMKREDFLTAMSRLAGRR